MFRRLAALPASIAGLLFAHEFAYRLVASDSRHRHALLDATGHGWLGLAPTLLAVAALVSFTHAWKVSVGNGRTPSFLQILAVQSGAYATVEIGERLISGHSPWPGAALLIAGAAVQLPAALFVWAVLRYVIVPAAKKMRALLTTGPLISPATRTQRWAPVFEVVPTRFVHTRAGRAPPSFC